MLNPDDHRLSMADPSRDADDGSQITTEISPAVSTAPQHRRTQVKPAQATTTTISPEGYCGEEEDALPELSTGLRWRGVSEKCAQDGRPHITPLNRCSQNLRRTAEPVREEPDEIPPAHPPSFAQSEFETIVRRQKTKSHNLKIMDIPSRFPNLDNDWEFAVGAVPVVLA